jgi:hypothetical protein
MKILFASLDDISMTSKPSFRERTLPSREKVVRLLKQNIFGLRLFGGMRVRLESIIRFEY